MILFIFFMDDYMFINIYVLFFPIHLSPSHEKHIWVS